MAKQGELDNIKQHIRTRVADVTRLPAVIGFVAFIVAAAVFGSFCLFGNSPVTVVISWVPTYQAGQTGVCAGSTLSAFGQFDDCSSYPAQEYQGFPFTPYYYVGSNYIALPPVDTFDNALRLTRILNGGVALLGAGMVAVVARVAAKSIQNGRRRNG